MFHDWMPHCLETNPKWSNLNRWIPAGIRSLDGLIRAFSTGETGQANELQLEEVRRAAAVCQFRNAKWHMDCTSYPEKHCANAGGDRFMLHFYVPSAVSHEGMPWSGPSTAANQLAGRFRTLVEHLLPEGCRFELTWDHPHRHHQDADLMYFQGYFQAALTGTARGGAELWKQQFRQALNDCIHGGVVNFLLESGTPIHIGAFNLPPSQEPSMTPALSVTRPRIYGEHNIGRIGPDQAGRLDVADLEHLSPQVAASALAHEFTEQRCRQVQHMSFETAHQTALLREMAVMGGERLSDHEQITDGVNFEAPPASEWQWWVPFRSRTHNAIAGVIMIMRGGNVQHCEVVQFPTLEAFQRAAAAALRAPAHPRTPTPTGAPAR